MFGCSAIYRAMIGNRIAIIIPFYNGLETIRELVTECAFTMSAMGSEYRIIVVDDSGNQEKQELLLSELSGIGHVKIVRLTQNAGQHIATFIGLLNTSNEDVITMDEDLQHRPEEISSFIEEHRKGKSDVIYADRRRPRFKRLIHSILEYAFIRKAPKTTCSFRLIDENIIKRIQGKRPSYCQLEGMIMSENPRYGYVKVDDSVSQRTSGSAYSLVSVFMMISSLLAFYSPFPWVVLNLFLIVISALTVVFWGWMTIFIAAPVMLFSIAVVINHIFALNMKHSNIEDLSIRYKA